MIGASFICTTGIGISIAANKVQGIRCAHCADSLEAEMTRRHNDANMLAIGAGFTGKNLAERMVEVFLSTDFEGGRHERRCEQAQRHPALTGRGQSPGEEVTDMGGTKGYRSYRGRTSKGKIALAVLLVLIILAAVGFLWLQEYIVYDRDGSFHLELPWKTETPPRKEEVPPEDVEIYHSGSRRSRRLWLPSLLPPRR